MVQDDEPAEHVEGLIPDGRLAEQRTPHPRDNKRKTERLGHRPENAEIAATETRAQVGADEVQREMAIGDQIEQVADRERTSTALDVLVTHDNASCTAPTPTVRPQRLPGCTEDIAGSRPAAAHRA